MERIPAACAVDWSIELDKGLRCKTTGKSIEAILEVGPRLGWWNREPELTAAEYNLFGLIPGEDKLFANAILLRLADTFVLGDKHTKLSIVKIFLSELKHRKKKRNFSRQNKGILLKCKVDNHLELLRRVKMGFDTGDIEVRALALVLFGCWSDFAKDSAEIRYLILSSIVSCHVIQVKASLFAAGCFCELSDDFASVFLEILANMLSSSEMPAAGRLAGARAFAKIGWSSSLANRAYKIGLQLLLDSSEEEFLVAMMISLSKVASRSGLLISRQVDLLFSFLSHDKTLRLQATSLSCLHFFLAREFCHFSPSIDAINTLFNMLHRELPPALLCKALQSLYKILIYDLRRLSCSDMLDFFTKLLTIVEIVMQSPIISNRLLAIRVLANISQKFMRRSEMAFDGAGTTLVSRTISFMMDRITFLAKSMYDLHQPGLEIEQEVWSLLKLLLVLLNECPHLEVFVLHKIYSFIEYLVNKDGGVLSTGKSDLRDQKAFIMSKLMLHVSRLVVFCLRNLDKAGALTNQVYNVVKLLVEHLKEIDENNNQEIDSSTSDYEYLIQNEGLALETAKKILARKDNWSAYMAGKYAACQGAWFTAAFVFGQLVTIVQSDSCYRWLKSLSLFAYSEMKVQSLNLPKERLILLNWLDSNRISALPIGDDLGETVKNTTFDINLHNYIGNLVGACKILRSSEEILGSAVVTSSRHCFQRWFLALRANLLGTAIDILKLLDTVSFTKDNISGKGQVEGNIQNRGYLQQATSLIYPLTQISTRLMKLAREYDLIATSFIGMGQKSLIIVSALALSCSSLAFSTGFALSFIHLLSPEHFTNHGKENFEDSLHAMLVKDLVVRLQHIDHETSRQLWLFLKACGQPRSCYIPRSSTQRLDNSYEVRCIVKVCSYAVMGVVSLQNKAKKVHDDEALFQIINGGLQLLLNVIMKWINIPFLTPNYFFRVRTCVSCQLFAMNRDLGNGDGISVLPGFHLHLDLCLQVNGISPDLQFQPTKFYCILHCRTSFQLPCPSGDGKRQTQLECQDWVADDMIDLNERLMWYASEVTEISITHDRDYTCDGGIAEAYVCFEPNEKGQGFSSCLLDVSVFPPGSYRIQWHGGCVDSEGSYWTLPSLNAGPVFTVQKSCTIG